MNYQWYPGHMTKAFRQMQEDIKLIDLIIEIVDGRIPQSSRNPDLDKLSGSKSRLIIINKSDLSDSACNVDWVNYFENNGKYCLLADSKRGMGFKALESKINEVCREKKERDLKRGIKNRPVRAMVAGIPNVGKSTFINTFTKRAVTKTGNKPGVTKGKQWIKLNKGLELLDTPGVLWPKFEDNDTGMKLAFIGSMNDQILVPEELATDFYNYLERFYPGKIEEYYNIKIDSTDLLLLQIAKARNCIKAAGELDLRKAAVLLMEDFRSGKLGRISLEKC